MTHELYFAFGSNLNEDQLYARCPSAFVVDAAWLHGEKLVFRSYSRRWRGGVASIVPSTRRTPGIVYAMSRQDLKTLDRFEGHPFAYKRERVHVQAQDNMRTTYECWTYRLPGGGINPPSPLYWGLIYLAYNDWGFDLRRLPRLSGVARAIEPYRDHAAMRARARRELIADRVEARGKRKARLS